MSDHGMTYGKNPAINHHQPDFDFDRYVVRRISLEQLLGTQRMNRHIRFVVGNGAYAMIYPKRQNINKVVDILQTSLGVRAQVYKKENIPSHLHWKHSKYCPPILVLARPSTYYIRVTPKSKN